jgi:hypothetical protein
MVFQWRWKPISKGDAHYMVAIGYNETSNNKFVKYLDPSPVGKGTKTAVSYTDWVGGDGHKHVFGWYVTDIAMASK